MTKTAASDKSRSKTRTILVGPLASWPAELKRILKLLRVGPGDLLVGVDHGAEFCLKAGFEPDLAVGDWDSLRNPKILSRLSHVTLPRDKDRSDTFYAAVYGIGPKTRELVCLGLTGGRPDHHHAVIEDLANLALENPQLKSVRAFGPEGTYVLVTPEMGGVKGRLNAGQIVSIFPLRGAAQGVTLKGLKYTLSNQALHPSSQGLSNLAMRGSYEVRLRKGVLLVIIPA